MATTIKVANYYNAQIIFPQNKPVSAENMGIIHPAGGSIQLPPVVLLPGHTTEIPKEIWDELKKLPFTKNLLDSRIIAELRSNKDDLPVIEKVICDLEPIIPDHLKVEEHEKGEVAKAGVKKVKAGKVVIE